MLKYFILIFIIISNATVSYANANNVTTKSLAQKDIQIIENYLNHIKTAEAEFIQLNQDGSINEGKFFLKKPGKFRWEYSDQPVIVVANGKSLIYYDSELEQSNYINIQDSIATLITQNKIKFNNDLKLIRAEQYDNVMVITATKSKQQDVGEFTFVFTQNPLLLKKIELLDTNQNKISINFMNMVINSGKIYDNSLFKIKDSRFK